MGKDTMNKIFVKVLLVAITIMAAWTVFLMRQSAKDTNYNYLYNAGLGVMFLLGMIPALIQVFNTNNSPLIKRIFLFFSLAQLTWALGSFGWVYYNLVANVEVPVPSLADIFYYAYYIFMGIGCLYLLKQSGILFSWKNVLGPFFVLFFAYIFIAFYLSWQEFSSQPLLKAVVDFMYPVCDAILFSIAFVVYNNQEHHKNRYSLYLILGILLQVLADILFSIFVSLNTYWNGGIPDFMYAICGFFLALAMVRLTEGLSTNT